MSKLAILDLGSLRFPSDAITIADLRKRRPLLFDFGFDRDDEPQPRFFFNADHAQHAVDLLGNMLTCERSVAATAYAKAEGIEPPDENYRELRDELITSYIRHDLASGPQHAEQLVRDIEQQAVALSKQRQQ